MGSRKLFFAVVLLGGSAFAQNNLVPVPPIFVGPGTAPRLGANLTITFCTSTATGAPCSPLAQAYADSTNSNPINQSTTPLKTDALGNAPVFYAAPGQYSYTVSGPAITTPQGPFQITVPCIPGGTCVATNIPNTGNLIMNPAANGVDVISSTRFTDTSPTGNFLNFKSLAGVTVFKVDILGNVTAPSATITVVTAGSNLGAAGNQGIAVKDINTGSAFTALGDSITAGFNATSAATDYVGLIAAAKGWTATNLGVASSQLEDAAITDQAFAQTVGTGSIYTMLAGHNDMRGNYNAAQQLEYQSNLYAITAWLSLTQQSATTTTSNKILGQDTTRITYTGTCAADAAIYGGTLAQKCTANGSTATATVWGSTVYFVYLKKVSDTGTFTLTVDGNSVFDLYTQSTTFNATGTITSSLGRTYEPQLVRVNGLTFGSHTVVMTVSTADATNTVEVIWIGSNSAGNGTTGPYVFLGNTVRLKSSDYGTFGGSDALVATFNRYNLAVASDLASDGLNVDYVDAAAYYDPNASSPVEYSTTGTFPSSCSSCPHPNNAGHQQIANAFLNEMSGIAQMRDRMGAQMFRNSGISTSGQALSVGGTCAGAAPGDGCFSRGQASGGIHLGNNGKGIIFQPGNTTQQFYPGNTGFPIAYDFGQSSSANYPRLKVSSAGQAQLRDTQDVNFFPLQVGPFIASSFGRVALNGSAPTCSVTGAGAGATCTVQTGSNDSGGQFNIGTGTAATASGTFTLTFSSTFGTNGTACVANLASGGVALNARATALGGNGTTSSVTWNWDNNAVSLTSSTANAVGVTYWCSAR